MRNLRRGTNFADCEKGMDIKMSEEKKVYCTQCGSENSGTAKFCSNCGAKLELPVADEQPKEAAAENTNVYAEGIFSGEDTSSYEKITNAEEIKPESIPAHEEIQINYSSQQDNFGNTSSQYSSYDTSNQPQYYSSGDNSTMTENNGYIGVSIASLVCGILSLICCCVYTVSWIVAIAAIVLGIIALVKKFEGRGMAIAGIATGSVAIVLIILLVILAASTAFTDIWYDIANDLY